MRRCRTLWGSAELRGSQRFLAELDDVRWSSAKINRARWSSTEHGSSDGFGRAQQKSVGIGEAQCSSMMLRSSSDLCKTRQILVETNGNRRTRQRSPKHGGS